jgi:hypothetical protein
MAFVVRAFPVLAGREESVRQLARSMSTERAAQTTDFYARNGVCHESWHLQETPAGPWVIAVSDIDAPAQRARQYSASQQEFDAWFKRQVLELTGIDPQTQPLGPPTQEIFAWSAIKE